MAVQYSILKEEKNLKFFFLHLNANICIHFQTFFQVFMFFNYYFPLILDHLKKVEINHSFGQ